MDIVSVPFPFVDQPSRLKHRPALVLSSPVSKHAIVIVAYITGQVVNDVETNVIIQDNHSQFDRTGLLRSSTIFVHKLASISVKNTKKIGELPSDVARKVVTSLLQILDVDEDILLSLVADKRSGQIESGSSNTVPHDEFWGNVEKGYDQKG